MYYPVLAPDGSSIYPIKENGKEGRWRISDSRMQELDAAGEIEYVYDEQNKKWNIYAKKYAGRETKTAYSSLLDSFGTSATGTKEIKCLFADKAFDHAKPIDLAQHLIHISNSRDGDIVLDYFAGSGTTSHAVINLNREDNGKRKFILVEMGRYFDTVSVICCGLKPDTARPC